MKRIIAVVMVLEIIIFLSGCSKQEFTKKEPYYIIPDFVGMEYSDIVLYYPNLNFKVEKKESEDIPAGFVISQSISEGKKIDFSQTITITVSTGIKLVEVPNFIGMQYDYIAANYSDFKFKVEKEESVKVPAGVVMAQSVSQGGKIKPTQVITIIVSKGSEFVEVPNFIGMQYEDIANNYSRFTFNVEYKNSNDVPAGAVMAQSISEGRKIKATQAITITVSTGPELVKIPEVVNFDLNSAKTALRKEGFSFKVEYKTDKEIAAGFVITTNPVGGGLAPYGSVIDIYVSVGAEVVYVPYTSYSGYDIVTTRKKIEEAGLTIGKITYQDSKQPKDIVISQSSDVSANPTIPKGTAIDLVVSTGKES